MIELKQNLYASFIDQAQATPEAVAVIDSARSLTFQDLASLAHGVAESLRTLDVEPQQPIAVLMHRNSDVLAGMLGVLAVRCCFVPLDPDDPPSRLAQSLADANCRIVIGHGDLLDGLRAGGDDVPMEKNVECLDVNALARDVRDVDLSAFRNQVESCDLAYIIFTSGSTGRPKGVEVEHKSIVNLLQASRDLLGFDSTDRFLATTTVGFDISVVELFLPLVTGGAVVVQDRRLVLEPRRLAEQIRRYGVTAFQTGPSVWSVLLDELQEFPHLKIAISTGEAISHQLAQRLSAVADASWNLYGPTEATVWATAQPLGATTHQFAQRSTSAPIGHPLDNISVKVLDEQQRPVSPNSEGELWLGGLCLARGYRGNEQLTTERFRPIGQPAERFYRTGDRVVQDDHGVIHYLGRNDDQLKIRGIRIEPTEIESAILRHPDVSQAAVTWFESSPGFRALVAGIVEDVGTVLKDEELREFLARLLPDSMIPSRYVRFNKIPVKVNGKVDRAAIRDQVGRCVTGVDVSKNKRKTTQTENTLIKIWERALDIQRVNRNDHFFTIGGDSLAAVTTMLNAEAAFGIQASVRVLFENPILHQLAEQIDAMQSETHVPEEGDYLFPICLEGGGTPVFFCTADLKLATHWSVDCPLYGLTVWGQGRGFLEVRSIQSLADDYLDRVRSVQSTGPYRFAGYDFGALVAVEMAQQMRLSGESVEMLFLLEPAVPRPAAEIATMKSLKLEINALDNGHRPAGMSHQRVSAWWGWLCYHAVHLFGQSANPVSERFLPKEKWPAFWYALRRLSNSYRVRPYAGPALAVIGEREAREVWQALLSDSSVIEGLRGEPFDEASISAWCSQLSLRLDTANAGV